MAESKLQNSSTKISKEKKSILDDDFGKEFLSSWKSKDDSLDFGPNTVSTGKKKAFNFGNLDMDFDLGGDFDKFSSFKVDVPDIDFASPATKAVPAKETSAGSSGATSRKNRDAIFSFDFNEFDNFGLDSSLTINTEKPVRNVNNKRVNSESSECQETRDLKFKQQEINEAADNDQNRKPDLPAADNGTTSFVESDANCEETANFSDDVTAQLRTYGESLVSHEEAPKITIIPTDQLPNSSDVAIEGETNGKQTPCIISAQPSGGQDFIVRNGSDVETNYLSCDAKTDSWHGLVDETTEVSCPDDVMKSPHKNPISLTSVAQENNESERASGDPIEDSMETEPSPNDINSDATCTSSLSRGGEIKKGVQTSAPKCLASVGIEAAGDSVIAGKKTESTITETRDFKMVKETERQVCQSPLSDIELPAPGKKGVVALQLSSSTNQRDPEAIRRNLAGNSSSAAQEMEGKPAFPERKKNAISLGNMRKVLNTGGLQKGCKLVDNLRIADTETDKDEAVVLGGIKSINPLLLESNKKSSPSSVDKPSELNHKMTSSSRIGLSRMGWNSNSKVITAEGSKSEKTSPVLSNMKISGNEKSSASSVDKPSEMNHKTTPSSRIGLSRMGMNSNSRLITVEDSKSGKTSPDLSNLKISGTIESIQDESPLLVKSESNLSRNWRIKEGKVNLLPMSLNPVFNADRKSPASMKRKISEVSKEDAEAFNSPKRLSPSPNESRIQNNCSDFKPTTSSSVVENQVRSQDDLAERKIKCVLYDHSTSSWETPGVNVKELEITSDLEDKGNVEKAEAYGKELDDICCMLKKKHEEAKELLVRAIVNNNSLLMLNHPMLDEKIRLVQKFGARLALAGSYTEEVRVP